MKIINLLPETEVKELQLHLAANKLLKFFLFVFFSLIVLFAAGLAARFYIEGSISQSKNDIANLQQQLSSSNNQALEKQVQALNTQIRNVKILTDQHFYWSKALIELGNITPTGIHFNSVSFDRATGKVDVTGYADKRDDVITFWSNVNKSSLFSGINFPLSNLEEATDTPFSFEFTVNTSSLKTP